MALGAAAVGGIVGAIIGLLWSDPYRNGLGQYQTYNQSAATWVVQAATGGILGSAILPVVLTMIASSPELVIPMGAIGLYLTYTKAVDPR